jgi:hypothetical protein
MEVCYWALLFMPLVILHHLLNVFVQLANKRGFTKKKKNFPTGSEAKNDFAGKNKQQFSGLDWTGLGCSVSKAELICTEALILSLAEIKTLPSYLMHRKKFPNLLV